MASMPALESSQLFQQCSRSVPSNAVKQATVTSFSHRSISTPSAVAAASIPSAPSRASVAQLSLHKASEWIARFPLALAWQRVAGPARGLRNLGICFMNATLQCLASTPALQQYLTARTARVGARGLGVRDGPASLPSLPPPLAACSLPLRLPHCGRLAPTPAPSRPPAAPHRSTQPRAPLTPASCAGWRPFCPTWR